MLIDSEAVGDSGHEAQPAPGAGVGVEPLDRRPARPADERRPIEATVMVKAGHLYELQYEFTPE